MDPETKFSRRSDFVAGLLAGAQVVAWLAATVALLVIAGAVGRFYFEALSFGWRLW